MAILPSKSYQIQLNGLNLTIASSAMIADVTFTYPISVGPNNCQQFYLFALDNSRYAIVSAMTGQAITVMQGVASNLVATLYCASDNQLFNLEGDDANGYKVMTSSGVQLNAFTAKFINPTDIPNYTAAAAKVVPPAPPTPTSINTSEWTSTTDETLVGSVLMPFIVVTDPSYASWPVPVMMQAIHSPYYALRRYVSYELQDPYTTHGTEASRERTLTVGTSATEMTSMSKTVSMTSTQSNSASGQSAGSLSLMGPTAPMQQTIASSLSVTTSVTTTQASSETKFKTDTFKETVSVRYGDVYAGGAYVMISRYALYRLDTAAGTFVPDTSWTVKGDPKVYVRYPAVPATPAAH